jgi:uncharacterized protein (TIGR00369 family)
MPAAIAAKRRPVAGRWPGNCFACSNPIGLNLRFFHAADGVVTDYTVPATFCGFDGMVHGGIISMILDEASCWALFARHGRLGVTREMTVRFVKPVPTGLELQVTGSVRQIDARAATVLAELRDGGGELLAAGESSWAFPRLGRIAGMAGVEEAVLQGFLTDCCPASAHDGGMDD